MAQTAHEPDQMSEDEIARYDRQIRLWGVKAQEKIRAARVLLITMRGLGNEVAKNLVLAGIGSLTIVDDRVVCEADRATQFLLGAAAAGTPRADAASVMLRQMNTRVDVRVVAAAVRGLTPEFYRGFDLVVATDLDPGTYDLVNTTTRLVDRPFYAAGTYGFYGFVFADLVEHDFTIVRDHSNATPPVGQQETETRTIVAADLRKAAPGSGEPYRLHLTKRELYSTWMISSDAAPLARYFRQSPRRMRRVSPALPCLRALWTYQRLFHGTPDETPSPDAPLRYAQFTQLVDSKQAALGTPKVDPAYIRRFCYSVAGGEISPVVTAVGAQLAQDVINVLGHTQQPIQNLVIFDGLACQAQTYQFHPDGPLGRGLLQSATATPEAAASFFKGAAAAAAPTAPPANASMATTSQAPMAGSQATLPLGMPNMSGGVKRKRQEGKDEGKGDGKDK